MGSSVLRLTYGTRDGRHTQIQNVKLLHQLSLWHGKLCRQNRRQSSPQVTCRSFRSQKLFIYVYWHIFIGIKEGNKWEVLLFWGRLDVFKGVQDLGLKAEENATPDMRC